jgi:DNA-binding response OmpR family regulator
VPASHESPAGTAPSVLLVEEYDALTAAIASALKKFAPRHRIHTVESLDQAEAAAVEIQPQLSIVDFDPPRRDAIQFLDRISSTNPETRFLAIASGIPSELFSERYGPNAIQFVEKPFELAEFGAAVQALIGSPSKTRGTLRDLNARDLIPLQCLNLATSVLQLRSADDRIGEIHFFDGQITHAATGDFSGPAALHQMIRWKTPRAREMERLIDAPRTIHGSWQTVVLEALRQTSTLPLVPPDAPALPKIAEPPKASVESGKKIVVVDDTEMLLVFVEDALITAQPSLQIVTALTGGEGFRRAETMLPDLVLLDYSLPDLRGDQVCERLLQKEETSRIPIIIMSGHVAEMLATARKYRNVVATIAKPFLSDSLIALVRETLAKGPLPPAAVAAPAAPPPRANGHKPAKKNGAGENASKKVSEAQSAPAPITPAPIPSAPIAPVPITPAPITPAPIVSAPITPPAIAPAPIAAAPIADPPIVTAPVSRPAIVAPLPVTKEAPETQEVAAPREIQPLAPSLQQTAPIARARAPLPAASGGAVVLGLGMEVIAVQFTPRFQIGTIRAKPTASTLSLTPPSSSSSNENFLAGFEIGPVELDAQGRIRAMRVVPTRQPAKSIQIRSAFEIDDVALLAERASIELTARAAAPMTVHLVALFKVAGVELSDRFEVAQLLLEPVGNRVRVSLNPESRGSGGTEFETVAVRLDSSARLAEFVLSSGDGLPRS